jgi:hypothetical protein
MKKMIKAETPKEEISFAIGKVGEDVRIITLAELRDGKKETIMAKAFGYDFIKPYKKDEKTTIAMMDGKKFHIDENGVEIYPFRFMDVKRFLPYEPTTLAMVSDETVPGGFYWTHIFRDGTFVHGMKFIELERFSLKSKIKRSIRQSKKTAKYLMREATRDLSISIRFTATGLTFDGKKETLTLGDSIIDIKPISPESDENNQELLDVSIKEIEDIDNAMREVKGCDWHR